MTAHQPTEAINKDTIYLLREIIGFQKPEVALTLLQNGDRSIYRNNQIIQLRGELSFWLSEIGFRGRGYSLCEIAGAVGFASHSSVSNSIKKFKKIISPGELKRFKGAMKDSGRELPLFSELDKLSTEILESQRILNPSSYLNRARLVNDRGSPIYKNWWYEDLRESLAFWLRDCNPPDDKFTYREIALAVGYSSPEDAKKAIEIHHKKILEIMQENPDASKLESEVDKMIGERNIPCSKQKIA